MPPLTPSTASVGHGFPPRTVTLVVVCTTIFSLLVLTLFLLRRSCLTPQATATRASSGPSNLELSRLYYRRSGPTATVRRHVVLPVAYPTKAGRQSTLPDEGPGNASSSSRANRSVASPETTDNRFTNSSFGAGDAWAPPLPMVIAAQGQGAATERPSDTLKVLTRDPSECGEDDDQGLLNRSV